MHRQNTFIDSVTHELKSPLASLKLCLQTQVRPELSLAQKQELHEMMLADIDRFTWGTCQSDTVRLFRQSVPDLRPKDTAKLKPCS